MVWYQQIILISKLRFWRFFAQIGDLGRVQRTKLHLISKYLLSLMISNDNRSSFLNNRQFVLGYGYILMRRMTNEDTKIWEDNYSQTLPSELSNQKAYFYMKYSLMILNLTNHLSQFNATKSIYQSYKFSLNIPVVIIIIIVVIRIFLHNHNLSILINSLLFVFYLVQGHYWILTPIFLANINELTYFCL